jgi:acyl dehydratase
MDATIVSAFDFPVEKGHIMAFARSLGGVNPAYFDEEYAASLGVSSVIAPPTFTQASVRFAPSHAFRSNHGEASPHDDGADVHHLSEVGGGTFFHAEQHFEYRRAVVAGETLRVVSRSGTTWEKEGRRGGRLSFSESFIDYFDQDGEIVVTARTVGVRTSRVVETM